MNKKSKKHYQKRMERLKRLRKEIALEILETACPEIPQEIINKCMDESNIYFQRAITGKWIDGSDPTPEQEEFMDYMAARIAEYMYHNASTENKPAILKRYYDLSQINAELNPDNKKVININI